MMVGMKGGGKTGDVWQMMVGMKGGDKTGDVCCVAGDKSDG